MPDRVRKFLLEFKQAATSGSGVFLVPRSASLRTLSHLGLTKRNLEEVLLGLSVIDYCKGPEPDRDRAGEIWIFGKELQGHELYIKLKVAQVNGTCIAKCISFHIAEYPMRYPFRTVD